MLWILTRKNTDVPAYDVANGFVVRAPGEREARSLAASQAGDEGPETWLRETESFCNPLRVKGKTRVLIRDYNAG